MPFGTMSPPPLRPISQNTATTSKKLSDLILRTTHSDPSLKRDRDKENEKTVSAEDRTEAPKKNKNIVFHIDGPYTPQTMEVCYSSSSSSLPSTPPHSKSRTYPKSSPPSPTPLRGSPASRKCLVQSPQAKRYAVSEADGDRGVLDWQEYSRPIAELDGVKHPDNESSWSGDTWTSGDGEDGVIVVTSPKTSSRGLSEADIASLFTQFPPVKTPQKERQKVSKTPNLPTITSEEPTPPSSPFTRTPGAVHLSGEEFTAAILSIDFDEDDYIQPEPKVNIPKDRFFRISRHVSGKEESLCDGCGRRGGTGYKKIMPCAHLTCQICFSASIAAVAVTNGKSRCAACMTEVDSFVICNNGGTKADINNFLALPALHKQSKDAQRDSDVIQNEEPGIELREETEPPQTEVLRIDNVAWDITPEVVESYLPPDSLPKDHPQPIHILLDRHDGRTKDFMFVEVASWHAAQRVLFSRQNSLMPGGRLTAGRLRPVTISRASHEQLINELRPKSKVELYDLLSLCQAAVECPPLINPNLNHTTSFVSPSGLAHFVKSRHGPFHALLSILSKLSGPTSPAYWDLLHVTSGAIAALANALESPSNTYPPWQRQSQKVKYQTDPQDSIVLNRLQKMHLKCFGKVLGLDHSQQQAQTHIQAENRSQVGDEAQEQIQVRGENDDQGGNGDQDRTRIQGGRLEAIASGVTQTRGCTDVLDEVAEGLRSRRVSGTDLKIGRGGEDNDKEDKAFEGNAERETVESAPS